MSACQLFGYSKNSLLSRNIKALIPDIIGNYHNRLLLNAEKREMIYFNQRKNTYSYGQQITGYIIPLNINFRKVLSFSLAGDQYVGLIYPIQFMGKYKEMHILLDTKLRITNITESCYRMLKLKRDIVKQQKIPITALIPNFPIQKILDAKFSDTRESNKFLTVDIEKIDVHIPDIIENIHDEIMNKPRSHSSNGSHEDDESVLTTLRRNEVLGNDSFIAIKLHKDIENIEENNEDEGEDEDEDEKRYVININNDEKLNCKISISSVWAGVFVGYAVKIIVNEKEDNSKVNIYSKIGKYQFEFYMKGNCFLRVPIDYEKDNSSNNQVILDNQ